MIHEGIYKWLVLLRENTPREISMESDIRDFAYMRRRLWGLMPDKMKTASSVYSQDESSLNLAIYSVPSAHLHIDFTVRGLQDELHRGYFSPYT